MYGDFSRLTFNRAKSYTSAWSQQGRMQLDCDFNEQTAIMLDWMRTLATDFMGPAGGNTDTAGFAVSLGANSNDLSLTAGHYYVAGIRCEIPAFDTDGTSIPITYKADKLGARKDKTYLVYLQVWERSVNGLLDPTLLEPALGPTSPDTTIRSQVVWSPSVIVDPKTWKGNGVNDVDYEAVDTLFATINDPDQPRPRATLQASPVAGYTGLENQLYRVEIHRGNLDGASPTFKWSRDNASVEFGIASADGADVTLAGTALPGRPKLEIGDCVEVIDSSWQPFDTPAVGPLYTVRKLVDQTVTLNGALESPGTPLLLRRWDGAEPADGTPVPDDGSPTKLENDIEVTFSRPDSAQFQRGDFWLIPARAATGRIYGPTTDNGGAPPYGPARHFAPLAQINLQADQGPPDQRVHDLRSLFTRLAWPLGEQARI
jgi:hypothetical protein